MDYPRPAVRIDFCHWKVLDTHRQHLALGFLDQLCSNRALLTIFFHLDMIASISTYCFTVIVLSCPLRNAGYLDWISANFLVTCVSLFGLLPQMNHFIHSARILGWLWEDGCCTDLRNMQMESFQRNPTIVDYCANTFICLTLVSSSVQ